MPIPKVRVGRLAPDQEALDYYDTEVKHWTPHSWDQLDMGRLDMGLHTDPTTGGVQAMDRRSNAKLLKGEAGLGANEMRDMRIHIGRELVSNDAGLWDVPEEARRTISNALADEDWELGELFEESFPGGSMSRQSTINGNPRAIEDQAAMRQWLMDNEFDTITYKNREEGVDNAVDAAINNDEFIKYEYETKQKIKDLEMQAAEAGRREDFDLEEELDLQANALDDELQYQRDDAMRQAEADNISHISLNPGNVRSADANFQRDMIGKPDMQGSATVPTMAGSAALGSLMSLAQNDDVRQGALDVGAGVLDSASRLGETVVNDLLTGSQMLSNSIYDTRDAAPQVQFAPRTEAGNTLSEGIMNDVGSALESKGLFGEALGVPSGMDLIKGGMKWYSDELKPYLSERQEQALGGSALLASMIGLPVPKTAKHLKRKGDAAVVNDRDIQVEGGALVPHQQLDPESLINRPYVSNMADTSAGDNSVITSVDGVPVNVERQGGFDYMRQPDNVNDGRLWASEKGAVTGILNAAGEAMELPGAQGSPLLLPWSMTPGRSSDFAHFSADLGVQHAQNSLDPRLFSDIDRRIRSGTGNMKNDAAPVQNWVGLANATPADLQAIGGQRKNVIRALDEFRGEGALDQSTIRHAVGDAEATNTYTPAQVLRVGEIDMDRGMLDESRHNTYSRGVAGEYLGSLNPGASVLDDPNLILRSGVNLRDKYGPKKDTLPSPQGKAMQSNAIGVLSEQLIEEWIKAGVFGPRR